MKKQISEIDVDGVWGRVYSTATGDTLAVERENEIGWKQLLPPSKRRVMVAYSRISHSICIWKEVGDGPSLYPF